MMTNNAYRIHNNTEAKDHNSITSQIDSRLEESCARIGRYLKHALSNHGTSVIKNENLLLDINTHLARAPND